MMKRLLLPIVLYCVCSTCGDITINIKHQPTQEINGSSGTIAKSSKAETSIEILKEEDEEASLKKDTPKRQFIPGIRVFLAKLLRLQNPF